MRYELTDYVNGPQSSRCCRTSHAAQATGAQALNKADYRVKESVGTPVRFARRYTLRKRYGVAFAVLLAHRCFHASLCLQATSS